jgi:hypothetical protein
MVSELEENIEQKSNSGIPGKEMKAKGKSGMYCIQRTCSMNMGPKLSVQYCLVPAEGALAKDDGKYLILG